MSDKISRERRSENMRRIRSKDTKPELVVRRYLHSLGFRYRLHRNDLPGKPDLVFPALRTVVFVHGCFWHGCTKCIDGTRRVKSNSKFWREKVETNRARYENQKRLLHADGWNVIEIWECETRDKEQLASLANALQEAKRDGETARASVS